MSKSEAGLKWNLATGFIQRVGKSRHPALVTLPRPKMALPRSFFLPFILKAVSALLVQTDGSITMLIALIQVRESPWLQFPGSISAGGEEVVRDT